MRSSKPRKNRSSDSKAPDVQKLWPKKSDLTYDAALRGFIFMLPMILAMIFGRDSWIVPFGQGGFFFSIMPLIPTHAGRFLNMLVMTSLGLGLYLIGGNSASHLWLAVFYAFSTGFVIVMLTSWRYIGMGAVAALVPVYTAGLNAGSPDKAASSFIGFTIIMLYCGLITMLPFWKTRELGGGPKQVSEKTRTLGAFRLALGSSIALFFSEIWNFSKLGWASSAVGSVIRPEEEENKSKRRAAVRAIGVIIGGVIATLVLLFQPSLNQVAIMVVIFTVINGLISLSPLGQMPIFYNAVILLLYSKVGATSGSNLVNIRILYNLLGIAIALFFVYYPLPYITRKVDNFFAGK